MSDLTMMPITLTVVGARNLPGPAGHHIGEVSLHFPPRPDAATVPEPLSVTSSRAMLHYPSGHVSHVGLTASAGSLPLDLTLCVKANELPIDSISVANVVDALRSALLVVAVGPCEKDGIQVDRPAAVSFRGGLEGRFATRLASLDVTVLPRTDPLTGISTGPISATQPSAASRAVANNLAPPEAPAYPTATWSMWVPLAYCRATPRSEFTTSSVPSRPPAVPVEGALLPPAQALVTITIPHVVAVALYPNAAVHPDGPPALSRHVRAAIGGAAGAAAHAPHPGHAHPGGAAAATTAAAGAAASPADGTAVAVTEAEALAATATDADGPSVAPHVVPTDPRAIAAARAGAAAYTVSAADADSRATARRIGQGRSAGFRVRAVAVREAYAFIAPPVRPHSASRVSAAADISSCGVFDKVTRSSFTSVDVTVGLGLEASSARDGRWQDEGAFVWGATGDVVLPAPAAWLGGVAPTESDASAAGRSGGVWGSAKPPAHPTQTDLPTAADAAGAIMHPRRRPADGSRADATVDVSPVGASYTSAAARAGFDEATASGGLWDEAAGSTATLRMMVAARRPVGSKILVAESQQRPDHGLVTEVVDIGRCELSVLCPPPPGVVLRVTAELTRRVPVLTRAAGGRLRQYRASVLGGDVALGYSTPGEEHGVGAGDGYDGGLPDAVAAAVHTDAQPDGAVHPSHRLEEVIDDVAGLDNRVNVCVGLVDFEIEYIGPPLRMHDVVAVQGYANIYPLSRPQLLSAPALPAEAAAFKDRALALRNPSGTVHVRVLPQRPTLPLDDVFTMPHTVGLVAADGEFHPYTSLLRRANARTRGLFRSVWWGVGGGPDTAHLGRAPWANDAPYDGGATVGAVAVAEARRKGFGLLFEPSGRTYCGMWDGGRRHGAGILWEPDGSSYEGDWLSGLRHGVGTWRDALPDGVAATDALGGTHHETAVLLLGHETAAPLGIADHDGVVVGAPTSVRDAIRAVLAAVAPAAAHVAAAKVPLAFYHGHWESGVRHGVGAERRVFAGEVYVGGFRYGERDGAGIVVCPDGTVCAAHFINGQLDGPALIIAPPCEPFPCGAIEVANFTHGARNGRGAVAILDSKFMSKSTVAAAAPGTAVGAASVGVDSAAAPHVAVPQPDHAVPLPRRDAGDELRDALAALGGADVAGERATAAAADAVAAGASPIAHRLLSSALAMAVPRAVHYLEFRDGVLIRGAPVGHGVISYRDGSVYEGELATRALRASHGAPPLGAVPFGVGSGGAIALGFGVSGAVSGAGVVVDAASPAPRPAPTGVHITPSQTLAGTWAATHAALLDERYAAWRRQVEGDPMAALRAVVVEDPSEASLGAVGPHAPDHAPGPLPPPVDTADTARGRGVGEEVEASTVEPPRRAVFYGVDMNATEAASHVARLRESGMHRNLQTLAELAAMPDIETLATPPQSAAEAAHAATVRDAAAAGTPLPGGESMADTGASAGAASGGARPAVPWWGSALVLFAGVRFVRHGRGLVAFGPSSAAAEAAVGCLRWPGAPDSDTATVAGASVAAVASIVPPPRGVRARSPSVGRADPLAAKAIRWGRYEGAFVDDVPSGPSAWRSYGAECLPPLGTVEAAAAAAAVSARRRAEAPTAQWAHAATTRGWVSLDEAYGGGAVRADADAPADAPLDAWEAAAADVLATQPTVGSADEYGDGPHGGTSVPAAVAAAGATPPMDHSTGGGVTAARARRAAARLSLRSVAAAVELLAVRTNSMFTQRLVELHAFAVVPPYSAGAAAGGTVGMFGSDATRPSTARGGTAAATATAISAHRTLALSSSAPASRVHGTAPLPSPRTIMNAAAVAAGVSSHPGLSACAVVGDVQSLASIGDVRGVEHVTGGEGVVVAAVAVPAAACPPGGLQAHQVLSFGIAEPAGTALPSEHFFVQGQAAPSTTGGDAPDAAAGGDVGTVTATATAWGADGAWDEGWAHSDHCSIPPAWVHSVAPVAARAALLGVTQWRVSMEGSVRCGEPEGWCAVTLVDGSVVSGHWRCGVPAGFISIAGPDDPFGGNFTSRVYEQVVVEVGGLSVTERGEWVGHSASLRGGSFVDRLATTPRALRAPAPPGADTADLPVPAPAADAHEDVHTTSTSAPAPASIPLPPSAASTVVATTDPPAASSAAAAGGSLATTTAPTAPASLPAIPGLDLIGIYDGDAPTAIPTVPAPSTIADTFPTTARRDGAPLGMAGGAAVASIPTASPWGVPRSGVGLVAGSTYTVRVFAVMAAWRPADHSHSKPPTVSPAAPIYADVIDADGGGTAAIDGHAADPAAAADAGVVVAAFVGPSAAAAGVVQLGTRGVAPVASPTAGGVSSPPALSSPVTSPRPPSAAAGAGGRALPPIARPLSSSSAAAAVAARRGTYATAVVDIAAAAAAALSGPASAPAPRRVTLLLLEALAIDTNAPPSAAAAAAPLRPSSAAGASGSALPPMRRDTTAQYPPSILDRPPVLPPERPMQTKRPRPLGASGDAGDPPTPSPSVGAAAGVRGVAVPVLMSNAGSPAAGPARAAARALSTAH